MKFGTAFKIMFGLIGASIILVIIGYIVSGGNLSSWNEGFNVSWAGTYVSKADADYVVGFKIGEDGTYALAHGATLTTTYSGKYNRNFNNGVTKSPLQYTVVGLRITNFDEKSITISVSWRLPSGNNTESYILYRQ